MSMRSLQRMLSVASQRADGSMLGTCGWRFPATVRTAACTSFGQSLWPAYNMVILLTRSFSVQQQPEIIRLSFLACNFWQDARMASHVAATPHMPHQPAAQCLLCRRGLRSHHVRCGFLDMMLCWCMCVYMCVWHVCSRQNVCEFWLSEASGCHAAGAGTSALKRYLAAACGDWHLKLEKHLLRVAFAVTGVSLCMALLRALTFSVHSQT